MSRLVPLRMPRSLLDPRCADLPPSDDDGLVTVQIEQTEGRVLALHGVAHGEDKGSPPPIALTPLLEPHTHLDKAFTGASFPNREGTMAGAMEANRREAGLRDADQVLARGEKALRRAWGHGIRAIRSHIDSLGPQAIPSWEALLSLRRRWQERLEIQLVALVPLHHWLTAEGAELARRVGDASGLLGGVLGPPFSSHVGDQDALVRVLELAERHGCGVDLHIDEADTQPARGLLLLQRVLRQRVCGLPPITCSHASSMALLGPASLRRLAETLSEAGVGVVALPSTNLWLLGKRSEHTPVLRVQAPIRELQAAGVTVAVGGDNVQDPWLPAGDLDPLALMGLGVLTSHLAPWRRLGLAPFTTAASRLMHLEWDGVLRVGGPADLVVVDATSWPELLARPPRRRVLRQGRWLPSSDDDGPWDLPLRREPRSAPPEWWPAA